MVVDPVPIANGLGFLALGSYILTLLPTNLRVVFPQIKQTEVPKWLLRNRRLIGIIAFLLALGHGYLLVQKRNFDFSDPYTFWIYIQGVSTFVIFVLLTITSNDWSVKRLKKNWKRLHSLTYLAMFLLTWHIWDKMANHWSYITPLSLIAIVTVNCLYLYRRWLEHHNKTKKQRQKSGPLTAVEKIAA